LTRDVHLAVSLFIEPRNHAENWPIYLVAANFGALADGIVAPSVVVRISAIAPQRTQPVQRLTAIGDWSDHESFRTSRTRNLIAVVVREFRLRGDASSRAPHTVRAMARLIAARGNPHFLDEPKGEHIALSQGRYDVRSHRRRPAWYQPILTPFEKFRPRQRVL